MKNLLIFAGLVFLLKGAADCFALADSVSVSSISSAYAAGYITGQVVAAFAFLAAGAGLIIRSQVAAKPRFPAA